MPFLVTTALTRPSPSKRSTSSPAWISTPWSVSTFWKNAPTVAPKPRSSVTSSCITIATLRPSAVSVAATSVAM